MNLNFASTALSIVLLMALAIPGFILVKTKMLSASVIPALAVILLYVNQPFITLYGFWSKTYETRLLAGMGVAFGLAFVIHIAMTLICKLCFFKDPVVARANAYTFAGAFGNCGFMGIPVVMTLMPDKPEALIYVVIFMAAFNLLAWTLGIYILTGDKKYVSIKKALLNPAFLALIVALPVFFCKVTVPEQVMTPIKFFADMNTPLSMIILGMRFATIRFKELFAGWGLYVSDILKLVVCPLLMYAMLLPLKSFDDVFKTTLLIMCAMPGANSVLTMAEKFGGDTSSAAKALLTGSLFSVVTIPLILLLPF